MKETELFNVNFEKSIVNNVEIERMNFEIVFNDEVPASDFISFYKNIKKCKNTYKIDILFHMSDISYNKENIISYMKTLIDDRNKFSKLNKIDLNEITSLDNNFNLTFVLDSFIAKEIDDNLLNLLLEKMHKFGFDKLDFKIEKMVEKDDFETNNLITQQTTRDNEILAKKLQDLLKEADKEIISEKKSYTSYNSSKNNDSNNFSRRGNFANINYLETTIKNLSHLPNEQYVSVIGQVFKTEVNVTKNDKYIVNIYIGDYEDAVKCT
ncbi:UNVERIFIED_CONTAM: hypothetical protein O8I53_05835 [Campylobacter lari]